jgi:hypothetical protein
MNGLVDSLSALRLTGTQIGLTGFLQHPLPGLLGDLGLILGVGLLLDLSLLVSCPSLLTLIDQIRLGRVSRLKLICIADLFCSVHR